LVRVSWAGVPSSSSRRSAGRLKRTQWTQVPRGASGSSQIRAKLFVPSGGSGHRKGGETSLPSPVYYFGMASPSWTAVLGSSIFMVARPDGSWLPPPLHPGRKLEKRTREGRIAALHREGRGRGAARNESSCAGAVTPVLVGIMDHLPSG